MGSREDSRIELHNQLKKFTPNLYFQPPANTKIVYPCIVYRLYDVETMFGNNIRYKNDAVYQLTLISRDPDDPMVEQVFNWAVMVEFVNSYTTDNLHHHIINIYSKF